MEDSMVRKVRALLERAASTEHDGEAESCREAAERLMVKYSIDAALLENKEGYKTKPTSFKCEMFAPYGKEKGYLLFRISEVFSCTTIDIRNGDFHVFGFESDLDMVWTLWESLQTQMVLELAPHNYEDITFKRSFMRAFANRVHDRLEEFYRAAVSESGGGTDLVLRDRKKDVDSAVRDEYPSLTRSRSKSRRNNYGAHHGHQAGGRADIGLAGNKVSAGSRSIGG